MNENQRLRDNLKKNSINIKKSMSETNFEDLVHFAKTENWLGDTTTVSSYMVSSKE